MTRLFRFLVLSVSVFALSVTAAVPAPAVVGSSGDQGFAVRLAIGAGDPERACSGALVSPGWVLTAASCFQSIPGEGAPPAGEPAQAVTATVGRPDLSATGGAVRSVVELVPHESRDLMMARLETPVTNVDPVVVGASTPEAGHTLTAAGYGRTATEWAPLHLKSGEFMVDSVTGGDISLTGQDGASICAGDAGGPVLRTESGGLSLVAVSSRSWQAGCFGADPAETRTGAVATVVTDVQPWVTELVATHYPVTWAPVYSNSAMHQTNSSVAVSHNGRWTAVVWQGNGEGNLDNGVHTRIWLRVYENGVSKYLKKVTTLNEPVDWRFRSPDVGIRDNGTAIVVFMADQDGDGTSQVKLKSFDSAGAQTGSMFVNSGLNRQQIDPRIDLEPNGYGFAVAYENGWYNSPENNVVRLAYFHSISSGVAWDRTVNSAQGPMRSPDVAMSESGNAIVSWQADNNRDGGFQIRVKSFAPNGDVVIDERNAPANNVRNDVKPRIDANYNGDFAISWQSANSGGGTSISFRSFTASGTAGPETEIPGYTHDVGIDDQRNVVVITRGGGRLRVQGFGVDGTTTGRLPELWTPTTANSDLDVQGALAVGATGKITLTYSKTVASSGFKNISIGTGLSNAEW